MSQNGHATIDTSIEPTLDRLELADEQVTRQPSPPEHPREVFRAKYSQQAAAPQNVQEAQTAIAASVDRLTQAQTAQMDRLDDAIDKMLAAVMHQPNAPRAAIGSPSQPYQHVDATQIAEDVARIQDLAKLKKTKLENGDVSYALPMDNVRATAANLIGYDREAFRECGTRTASPHLEVVGLSDRQIAAAMAFAKQRWNGDGVIIHAEGQHRDRIIEHAVRADLNIDTSRNPEMAMLVAKERERQANPLTRDRSEQERMNIPLLERVPAQGRSR